MYNLNERLMEAVESTHLLRDKFLADRTRPGYHFACPEDYGMPGDVNCCFYSRGRYHLMYIYESRSDFFRYGHLSSTDLVHWRAHPDAVIPDELDGGIFSGGAFVDDDGTCYISYWALGKNGTQGGVRIAKSSDRYYEKWEKFEDYMLPCTESGVHETVDENGTPMYLGCADPSNIWKKNGKYYIQLGNLPVLIKFGVSGHWEHTNTPRDPNTPDNVRGDWTELFESDDLKTWKFVHRFYERRQDDTWTQANEDDMCPVFLPLPKKDGSDSGKHLQLFISHNLGCQYYIGTYDKTADLFLPESHGRMTWKDFTFFAPEALTAPDGRVIMWAWLHDNLYADNDRTELETLGWTGVFSMPRELWLREDGTLGMAPAKELRMLRYNETDDLSALDPVSCEIELEFAADDRTKSGLRVFASPDGGEFTDIFYDHEAGELVVDMKKSGIGRFNVEERAPFRLEECEKLRLDIFLDKSVIEVYANGRQAICRRVFTSSDESCGIGVIGAPETVRGWDMMPSNFY